MNRKLTILLLLLFTPMVLWAGTTGKIAGKVTDIETGEPLIGVNLLVMGTSFGAATDINGEYEIRNLDAGTYDLRASYVGYRAKTVTSVRVNADLTTEIDFQLGSESFMTEEISVVAERPLVKKDKTNAQRITTSEDIDALPVRGINAILGLTPGVVLQDNTVFIRGGRRDEVGFYLEGASITDALYGGRAVTIAQDAVEEIQVQAGGYTAEFGGANAGIIRQQIKSGGPDFKATMEFITDDYTFKGKDNRFDGEKTLGAYTYGYNEFVTTLSGPVLSNKVKFFGLFRYLYNNDANPQPYPGMDLGWITDPETGDSANFVYPAGPVLKNQYQGYTGTGSLNFDFNPILIRLVGTYTSFTDYNPWTTRTSGNIAQMFNSQRVQERNGYNGTFSGKLTHIINPQTYYEINVGYTMGYSKSWDPILQDDFLSYGDSVANANAGIVWDREGYSQYGRFQPPVDLSVHTFSFMRPGDVAANYLKSDRNNINVNAALTMDIGNTHSIKLGGEFRRYSMSSYTLGNASLLALSQFIYNNEQLADGDPNKRTVEQLITAQGVNNYGYDAMGEKYDGDDPLLKAKNPVFIGAYIQDKISWEDLIVNVGLRFDYIDIDNLTLPDPTRPELAINKGTAEVDADALTQAPTFSSVSPRLGFSFPITDQTVFHAQYGQFVQQTRLRDVYTGWNAIANNIAGGYFILTPVGFDVRPTRTTQYEIGFTQQIADFASIDITGFYKDIKDQVVYEQQRVAPGSPFNAYYVLKNGDFATTKGIEFSFQMRRVERLQASASLAFQDARGTGSFPYSNRGIVGAPPDPDNVFTPQYVTPLEYNNAIRGNVSLDYRFGKNDGPALLEQFGVSALINFNSGHPYTRGDGAADLEGDARGRYPVEPLGASTTPWFFQVDMKIDKTFSIADMFDFQIYAQIVNLFDTDNIENVFLRTGAPDNDGFLSDPELGGIVVSARGAEYEQLYKSVNLDYSEQYQNGGNLVTASTIWGPPRQIRIGVRLEY